MHRSLLAALLVVSLSAAASAQQTVSAIIAFGGGDNVASGFRDIPPGEFFFQVTLQSNNGNFSYTGLWGTNGGATWVPQGEIWGVSATTYATTAAYTESSIGTVGGYGWFADSTEGTFYTTNAFWTDTYDDSGDYDGGPYYDAGVRLPATNTSLPSSFPGGAGAGVPLPSFELQGSGSGNLWITSSDSNAAVYQLDQSSGNWVKADQPFAVTLPLSNYQFGMRATTAFVLGSVAQITVYYASSDSVNGTAGDTLDILNAFGDDPPNTDD